MKDPTLKATILNCLGMQVACAAAFVFALACGSEQRRNESPTDSGLPESSQAGAPAAPPSSGGGGTAIWHAQHRTLDFTGDGVVDTVHLRAIGAAVDSLRIQLTFWSAGAERWQEEWASDYELVVPPPPADPLARAAHLRRRLDRTLASVEVEPFDSMAYVSMARTIDSTILRQPPVQQVSFTYGYETTVVLAWDRASGRLRLLHACC